MVVLFLSHSVVLRGNSPTITSPGPVVPFKLVSSDSGAEICQFVIQTIDLKDPEKEVVKEEEEEEVKEDEAKEKEVKEKVKEEVKVEVKEEEAKKEEVVKEGELTFFSSPFGLLRAPLDTVFKL